MLLMAAASAPYFHIYEILARRLVRQNKIEQILFSQYGNNHIFASVLLNVDSEAFTQVLEAGSVTGSNKVQLPFSLIAINLNSNHCLFEL